MRQRPLNPMLSSVIICPVVRLNETRRQEKSFSFLIAIAVHVVIFMVGSLLFVHKPQFAVLAGEGSIEVDLIATPDERENAPVLEIPPVKNEPALMKEEVAKEVPKKQVVLPKLIKENIGKDQETLQSTNGAITKVKPDYLQNPAPHYPEAARRKQQQGLVLLTITVDRFGKPTKVEIKQGSGVDALDQAAAKVIWKWKFKPAYAGSLAVDSIVNVPIRFRLDD